MDKIEFIPMGYGETQEIIGRLPKGAWTIICDNDAAEAGMESCWFRAEGDEEDIIKQYREDGGTVSYAESMVMAYETRCDCCHQDVADTNITLIGDANDDTLVLCEDCHSFLNTHKLISTTEETTRLIPTNGEYEAEDVYESFQDPASCRDLVRMLLNSGLLADILQECVDYVDETRGE